MRLEILRHVDEATDVALGQVVLFVVARDQIVGPATHPVLIVDRHAGHRRDDIHRQEAAKSATKSICPPARCGCNSARVRSRMYCSSALTATGVISGMNRLRTRV